MLGDAGTQRPPARLPQACHPSPARGGGHLGQLRRLNPAPLQVDAKATLGLGGVAVVLGAVTAAMGFFSYLGVPSSLVILQVVPFLVLAVGADNIFILVLEYQVRGRGSLLLADPALYGFGPLAHSSSAPAFVSTVCAKRSILYLAHTCIPTTCASLPCAERHAALLGLLCSSPRTCNPRGFSLSHWCTFRAPGMYWKECAVHGLEHAKHVSRPDPEKQGVRGVCSSLGWGLPARAVPSLLALDAVPGVPTQRLPRRPGERREDHIGRALGRVAPSMLLCSLSEAICFFLGEAGQPLPTGVVPVGSPFPLLWQQMPRPEIYPCTPRGPDPHASGEDLRPDLRLGCHPGLSAAGVSLRGPAVPGQ